MYSLFASILSLPARGKATLHPGARVDAPATLTGLAATAMLPEMLFRLTFASLVCVSVWLTYRWTAHRFANAFQSSRRVDLPMQGIGRRLWRLVAEVLLQSRVIANRPIAGLLHAVVMWGFIAFGWVSMEHLWLGIVGLGNEPGPSWYRSFVASWAVVVTIGIAGLAFRRFVIRPKALGTPSLSSGVVAALIVILMATYLADWSGLFIHGSSGAAMVWWAHTLALLAFPPLIVRSKHLHLVLAPAAIFWRSDTTSRMRPLDLENEDLGMSTFNDLSFKDILDMNACVECGRCTDACPANRSGGTLSPKQVILQMQRGYRANGEQIAGTTQEVADSTAWVSEDDLMQCYACGACEQACPVGIEHVGAKILDMRRGLASNGSLSNERAVKLFGTMQRYPHNVWGLPGQVRTKFIADEQFPIFAKGMDVLFWLGCGNGYEPQGQKVASAMRKILDASGVSWGVLEQETCCGEPARRLGDETLFLMELSDKITDTFRSNGVRTVVTCCPHCTSMLDGDYRQLDEFQALDITVLHHTEFITQVMDRIPLSPKNMTAVYHDPCNLARGRNITTEPRKILRDCGATLSEAPEHGHGTMCCGAGGGQLFISDDKDTGAASDRVNYRRLNDLLATSPEMVAVACPYCPIMLRDAAEARESDVPILDVAEVIADRLAHHGEVSP